MATSLPNGSVLTISSKMGNPIQIKTFPNAETPSLTLAASHGLVVGDVVLIQSGWANVNDRVTEVLTVTGEAVTLADIDTSNKDKYSAGSGIGSLIKITEWVEVPQIKDFDASGGEQQTTSIQFLSDEKERKINTIKSAQEVKLTLAHDSSLDCYPLLRKFDENQGTCCVKIYVPKASEKRYFAGTLSFNDTPVSKQNEVETVAVNMNMTSSRVTLVKL